MLIDNKRQEHECLVTSGSDGSDAGSVREGLRLAMDAATAAVIDARVDPAACQASFRPTIGVLDGARSSGANTRPLRNRLPVRDRAAGRSRIRSRATICAPLRSVRRRAALHATSATAPYPAESTRRIPI